MNLLAFRDSVYSQGGEDGVIAAALAVFPATDRWCVEFGAADGMHLSNTRKLIERSGYNAVLIEPDPKSFAKLKANTKDLPGVTVINEPVGFSAGDGLDRLLARTACPRDFDFLSIDVDGNDLHIWRAVEDYRPKLVCVEYNPTMPTEVVFTQPADANIKWGSSIGAFVQLGKSKGYELVCAAEANAFFVTAELFPLFGLQDNSPASLRPKDFVPVFAFSGFDGTLLLSADISVPWHGISVSAEEIQAIPAMLRKYPLDYNSVQRLAARGFRFIRRAKKALRSYKRGPRNQRSG